MTVGSRALRSAIALGLGAEHLDDTASHQCDSQRGSRRTEKACSNQNSANDSLQQPGTLAACNNRNKPELTRPAHIKVAFSDVFAVFEYCEPQASAFCSMRSLANPG